MDEKTRNIVLVVVGGILVLVSAICLPLLVWFEISSKGSVSTQLATLMAIPLGAGAAMVKAAMTRDKPEEKKESE